MGYIADNATDATLHDSPDDCKFCPAGSYLSDAKAIACTVCGELRDPCCGTTQFRHYFYLADNSMLKLSSFTVQPQDNMTSISSIPSLVPPSP